jgi:acetyltransferase-like isoleucine patch superfamily enzyme
VTGDCQPFIHPTAEVDPDARIGPETRIWHQAQVARDVEIGAGCTLGKCCYIGTGSRVGSRVKIGNHADVFGAIVEDEAMICPNVVLAEDPAPRATRLDGHRQRPGDWTSHPVTVRRGATVGIGACIAPGVEIGQYALAGVGSVVLRDVRAHGLVLGNPARQCGWVCHCGTRLSDQLACPRCARRFMLSDEQLEERVEIA